MDLFAFLCVMLNDSHTAQGCFIICCCGTVCLKLTFFMTCKLMFSCMRILLAFTVVYILHIYIFLPISPFILIHL